MGMREEISPISLTLGTAYSELNQYVADNHEFLEPNEIAHIRAVMDSVDQCQADLYDLRMWLFQRRVD